MKIAIDLSALKQKNISGVGRYLSNVLKELLNIDNNNEYFLFNFGWKNESLNFKIPNKKNIKYVHKKIPNKLFFLTNFLFSWPKLDFIAGQKMDFVWLPNFNPCSLKFKKTKLITTVHDLSFVKYPEFLNFKRRLWHFFIKISKIIKRSDKLIAVSKNTSLDLQNIYGVLKSKILVSYLGLEEKYKLITDIDVLNNFREEYNLPKDFLLFLGTKEPRKNILAILQAFQSLKNKEINLIIVGGKGWKTKLWEKYYDNLSNEIKQRILFFDYFPEEDLSKLYNLAKIFIWPTFYEGFGLPILEALACACPIITSNNSSLSEIITNQAILIESFNVNQLEKAIAEILENENLYNYYKNKKIDNSFYDNWKISAEKLLKMFNEK